MRYEADMALIRHGMTPGNEEHRYIGRTDEPLSQKGREQLHTLQIREMDFGAFEGHNYEELKADVRYQAWIDSNGTLPFPQGESREQFQRRCVEGFCELLKEVWTREKLPASLALIVHGGTIMALLDAFAEGSYYDYQCANAKGYKGRLSVEFDAAGNTLRDTIKIADVRKLEE